jgi:hypothetical protein
MSKIGHTRWSRTVSGAYWVCARDSSYMRRTKRSMASAVLRNCVAYMPAERNQGMAT